MSQIDQSNFKPTEHPHVFMDGKTGEFFFCDETSEAHGPFVSLDQATANFDIYVQHNLNPVETMSESLKAMLGGDNSPLIGMLRNLTMLARPRISAAQRQLEIDQSMEAIIEEIDVGRALVPEKGLTAETAAIEMATRILLSFHDNEDMPGLLKSAPIDITTYEGAKDVIRRFFVERMFQLAPGGDGTEYVSTIADGKKNSVQIAREMTKGFWETTSKRDQIDAGTLNIPDNHKDVAHKVSDLAAYVTTEARRRCQEFPPETVLVNFAKNLQAVVIQNKADDIQILKDFVATNMASSVDDIQEAMHMIALLAMEYTKTIHHEDKDKDVMEQRWDWNDRGEVAFRELANSAIERTKFELM